MTRRGLLWSFGSVPAILLARGGRLSDERELFALVNQERESRGLQPLRWSDSISRVALGHSSRMAAREFFAHHDPEAGDLRDRLQRGNVQWMRCAENLFRERGYPSVVEPALTGWLQSPAHLANMLHPEYTASGIGISVARSETVYVTQVFVRNE